MSPPNTVTQKGLGKDNVVPIEKPKASPLPDGISSVEPFDYALLPEVFRPWIKDTAERMQCPPDYLAVSAMVAIAALAGRQVTIRPKRNDNWTVVPNLFGAVVGPPGVLKSPALKEPIRPLYEFQSKAMEDFGGRQNAAASTSSIDRFSENVTSIRVNASASNSTSHILQFDEWVNSKKFWRSCVIMLQWGQCTSQ